MTNCCCVTEARRGTLFLVVGPSGAGKDTLIAAARKNLASTHIFPRRVITRPSDGVTEDHRPSTVAGFAEMDRTHQFALTWHAHKLSYGIPISIASDLAAGKHVIINVSREVVAEARNQFRPSCVVLITASKHTLAERLRLRGREVPADIEERLARQSDVQPDITILNDGSIETASKAFVEALRG